MLRPGACAAAISATGLNQHQFCYLKILLFATYKDALDKIVIFAISK
jgi:hypothetical protein